MPENDLKNPVWANLRLVVLIFLLLLVTTACAANNNLTSTDVVSTSNPSFTSPISATMNTVTKATQAGVLASDLNIEQLWKQQYPNHSVSKLNAISCPTVSKCIAVGENGKIQITNSDGSIWKEVALNPNYRLLGLACPTINRCLAVGFEPDPAFVGLVLITEDGGNTWIRLDAKVSSSLMTSPVREVTFVWR